jgi:hypothetical protein
MAAALPRRRPICRHGTRRGARSWLSSPRTSCSIAARAVPHRLRLRTRHLSAGAAQAADRAHRRRHQCAIDPLGRILTAPAWRLGGDIAALDEAREFVAWPWGSPSTTLYRSAPLIFPAPELPGTGPSVRDPPCRRAWRFARRFPPSPSGGRISVPCAMALAGDRLAPQARSLPVRGPLRSAQTAGDGRPHLGLAGWHGPHAVTLSLLIAACGPVDTSRHTGDDLATEKKP